MALDRYINNDEMWTESSQKNNILLHSPRISANQEKLSEFKLNPRLTATQLLHPLQARDGKGFSLKPSEGA